MDTAKYLPFVQDFVVNAGEKAFRNWSKAYVTETHSGGADVSTNLDAEIEREFYEQVSKLTPEFGFRGEELPELNHEAEYTWQIDPIDGTKFYAKGIPFWSVTVALVRGDEPVLGAIYNPVSKDLYLASQAGGATVNGRELKINPVEDVSKIQVAWDQSHSFAEIPEEIRNSMHTDIARAQDLVYRVRFLGSGAYSLAWLAQGLFAAYIDTYRPLRKLVDTSAGVLIASEAGAEVVKTQIDADHVKLLVAAPGVLEALQLK